MSAPVRVGLVGFGYWGPNLARNIDRLPDAEFVAAFDASAENSAKLAAAYPSVEIAQSLDDLLSDRFALDAVMIATSAPSHAEIGKAAIRAGKHTFIEKPLALTATDAEDLVALAEEHDVRLFVGHLMVYHSAVRWVRDYIASGELGEVLYLYTQRLNLGKVRADENAFWSLAPHDVSVVLYLLGETPSQVSANGAAYLHDGVHDTVFANLQFASGKMANIHVSWLDPHKVRRFTIVGSKKMLYFDDMNATDKIWIYDKGVAPSEAMAYGEDLRLRFGDITVPFVPMKEPLAVEVQCFLDVCRGLEETPSDGRAGLEVVRVLEAVDASIAAGGAPVATE